MPCSLKLATVSAAYLPPALLLFSCHSAVTMNEEQIVLSLYQKEWLQCTQNLMTVTV